MRVRVLWPRGWLGACSWHDYRLGGNAAWATVQLRRTHKSKTWVVGDEIDFAAGCRGHMCRLGSQAGSHQVSVGGIGPLLCHLRCLVCYRCAAGHDMHARRTHPRRSPLHSLETHCCNTPPVVHSLKSFDLFGHSASTVSVTIQCALARTNL